MAEGGAMLNRTAAVTPKTMSSKVAAWAGLFSALALVLGCPGLATAGARQQAQPAPQAKVDRLIYSIKGADLYRAHCAPCHGSEGKGNGPMAAALKVKVPDLTALAKNNAGQFPTANVRKMIAGDQVLLSHGSREMPIWGPIFHQIEDDQDFGTVRVENLVKYLQSIQQK
jgi:mono/diheme cytochrome c family protein